MLSNVHLSNCQSDQVTKNSNFSPEILMLKANNLYQKNGCGTCKYENCKLILIIYHSKSIKTFSHFW